MPKKIGSRAAELLREKALEGQYSDKLSVKLTDVFEQEPVDLTTFVTDSAFLNNPPLSDIQYDALRHMEQIYLPETYPGMIEEFGDYWIPYRPINFAWLEWGKGSGKDHICRLASARVAYLLLCLKSPQEYFDMPIQDEIQTLNVASSAGQAHRAFFRPLVNLAKKSKCFTAQTAFHPTEYSIKWGKGIESVSGHSEAESQEGLNLILGIADEISAFKTKDEAERHARTAGGREPAKTAESILKMMRTSASTRFPRCFKIAAISYPRYKGDAIQQLRKKGEADIEKNGKKSRVYVSGPHATWQVNPRVESKEVFREDYEEDPAMAKAMYECKPDFSVGRYFRNDQAVYASFDEKPAIPPIEVVYFWGKADDEEAAWETGAPSERPGWQARFQFSEAFYPMEGAAYALHGDLALNGDRAGISMCHVRNWQEGEWHGVNDEVYESRPIVKVDFCTAFEADVSAQPFPREIQLRWFRKLVWELIRRGFYIASVTFDSWQSVDTNQILTSRGIQAEKLSMDRSTEPWEALRDVMYDGRLEGYWNPRLIQELLSLMRLPNGKVDHPPGGSKDEADALCGAVVGALIVGGSEGEAPERADQPGDFEMTTRSPMGGGLENFDLGVDMKDLAPPRI